MQHDIRVPELKKPAQMGSVEYPCHRCYGALMDDHTNGQVVCTACGLVNECQIVDYNHSMQLPYEHRTESEDAPNWINIIPVKFSAHIESLWTKYNAVETGERLAVVKLFMIDRHIQFSESAHFCQLKITTSQFKSGISRISKIFIHDSPSVPLHCIIRELSEQIMHSLGKHIHIPEHLFHKAAQIEHCSHMVIAAGLCHYVGFSNKKDICTAANVSSFSLHKIYKLLAAKCA